MYIIVAIIVALPCYLIYRLIHRRMTRNRLLQTRLSSDDYDLILQAVPLLARLPDALRPALEGKINLFLHQVTFHGCNGVDITKDMRLSIAAQAALLVVNIDDWYKTLRTVLVYPSAFKSVQRTFNGVTYIEEEIARTGESWLHGPVILSWVATEYGASNSEDGKNVVLHEFAHQLDALSGHTDAAPNLRKGQSFAIWAKVFVTAFKRHTKRVQKRRKTVLDPYGATAIEELFAVSIEAFFEKPDALSKAEPDIYKQLTILLQLDPKTWDPSPRA
jgi:Mlc titration factor MtfA (ptsG expression regulator)